MCLAQQIIWWRPDDSLYLAWETYASERERKTILNGTPERSDFVTFRERTVWRHIHSRQVPCACVTVRCTCLLTDPAEVTWARPSSSFSDQGPWQAPLGVPLAAIPSPVPSSMALCLPEGKPAQGECWVAGRWQKGLTQMQYLLWRYLVSNPSFPCPSQVVIFPADCPVQLLVLLSPLALVLVVQAELNQRVAACCWAQPVHSQPEQMVVLLSLQRQALSLLRAN